MFTYLKKLCYLVFHVFLSIIISFNIEKYDQLFCFCMIVIYLSILFHIINIKNKIIKSVVNKRCIIYSIISLCFFLIMLPISDILTNKIFINFSIINKILFIVLLIYSWLYIFIFIINSSFKSIYSNRKTSNILIIIMVIISLLFVMSTTTGYYDYDFPSIWNSINKDWCDMHPVAFIMLVYVCKIFNTPYIIIIINFILFIYFLWYSIKILNRENQSNIILIIYFLIYLFNIVQFDQLRFLNKDVIFSLSFCNLLISIFDYLLTKKFTKQIKINLIIFSFLVSIFRHGSIYLIILYFLIFIIKLIKIKDICGLKFIMLNIIICLGLFSIVNYVGYRVYKIPHFDKNYSYTIPIYQIGAFANNGYIFSLSDKQSLENNFYLPIEYMKNHFIQGDGDALTRTWRLDPIYAEHINDYNYNYLLKINFHLFIDKPIFYIKSLLNMSQILWKINGDNYFKTETYIDSNGNITYDVGIKETILAKPVNWIVNKGLKLCLFNIKIRGGISNFLIIVSLLIIIYKSRMDLLIPFILIFIWYLLLTISIPMSNTRYCLPFINIYPFIVCLSLGIKTK